MAKELVATPWTSWTRSVCEGLLPAVVAVVCVAVWSAEAQAERPGIAVIIGNKDYQSRNIPPVDYALRDAEAFKRYVVDVLGYAREDVIHIPNATRRQMLEVLGGPDTEMNDLKARLALLRGMDQDSDKDVLVYYSGHGVPAGDQGYGVPGAHKGKPYLLPVDVPVSAARVEGYSLEVLYRNLGKLRGVRSVRVFLDTCFSGNSDGGVIVTGSAVSSEARLPETGAGLVVLTAARSTQIATWDREAQHGRFTHHLLDALYGKADANSDRRVTAKEAISYLELYMTNSLWLNEKRIQNATLQGSGDQVLALARADGVFPERPRLSGPGAQPPRPEFQRVPAPAAEPDWDLATKRLIQEGLSSLNFDLGKPDGIFGKRTEEAIRRWQASKGLRETGRLTAEQGAALKVLGEETAREKQEQARRAREMAEAAARQRAELERQRRERLAQEAKAREEAARRAQEAERPGREFRDCGECPEMVVVPSGEYTMGSPDGEKGRFREEGPRHRVRIGEAFAVGKYEVTFGEWDACVAGGGCRGYRPDDGGWGRGRRPVIRVSWEDAKGYVEWLSGRTGKGYRLLSEAEWEYVARAGTAGPFHMGSTIGTDQANYDGNYTYGLGSKGRYRKRTIPVGSFLANGFGLHDVHGNVYEWVEDCWHGSYEGAPTDGSAWVSGGDCSQRVLRGGSWGDIPRFLRSANRFRNPTSNRYDDFGFRIARTLAP